MDVGPGAECHQDSLDGDGDEGREAWGDGNGRGGEKTRAEPDQVSLVGPSNIVWVVLRMARERRKLRSAIGSIGTVLHGRGGHPQSVKGKENILDVM